MYPLNKFGQGHTYLSTKNGGCAPSASLQNTKTNLDYEEGHNIGQRHDVIPLPSQGHTVHPAHKLSFESTKYSTRKSTVQIYTCHIRKTVFLRGEGHNIGQHHDVTPLTSGLHSLPSTQTFISIHQILYEKKHRANLHMSHKEKGLPPWGGPQHRPAPRRGPPNVRVTQSTQHTKFHFNPRNTLREKAQCKFTHVT